MIIATALTWIFSVEVWQTVAVHIRPVSALNIRPFMSGTSDFHSMYIDTPKVFSNRHDQYIQQYQQKTGILKQTVTDSVLFEAVTTSTMLNSKMEPEPNTGISILVVGAGIAGLTFAIEACRKGHNVRVIERRRQGDYSGK
jgi:heterodisulfide reductase subunit A-like polyferredoxin